MYKRLEIHGHDGIVNRGGCQHTSSGVGELTAVSSLSAVPSAML